jgi:choline/glycine/proline betaine transport protein
MRPDDHRPDPAARPEHAPRIEPGQNAPDLPRLTFGPHFEMHPVVFPAGALAVLALVVLTIVIPGADLEPFFERVQSWIGTRFGWLYVASLTGFLAFAVWLALGPFGRVRLGADDEKPEFGRLAWFSMLFSAGMGIGLVFWAVAEPIEHFTTTPPGFAEGLNESRIAMAVTIFHWGLHPWALYAVVGLALAYFGFRRGMPLGFRSLLHPLLGDRVWGRTGDAIDTLAIIATLTGVATSLGLGAKQVNAGFAALFGMPLRNPK